MPDCMLLTVITCVIRPAGALAVARSVQAALTEDMGLRHLLAYWPHAPVADYTLLAPWLTELIGSIRDGWLMFVDDDNRLHPDLPHRLAELTQEHPDARAFVFDCAYPEMHQGMIRAAPDAMRPGAIDGGQAVLWWELAQAMAWPAQECGDGHYLAALYRGYREAFVFVNEPLTYHNHQVWA